jgi:glucokinase
MTRSSGVLIGVDVGGTTISGGLVTPVGEVLTAVQLSTHRDGPGTALDDLLRIIDELVGQASDRRLTVEGIGIGLPGIVDVEAGMFRRGIARIPELAEIPLAGRIQAKTGISTFMDNDVNALALAEWTWGLGRGAASLVMLALGTGLGGALILDGRLVRGKNGYGGEFGHVSVKLDGRPCICGIRGCLAAYAAGFGIATEARRRAHHSGDSLPAGPTPNDDWKEDAEAVFRAAAKGDAVARAIVEEACRALGAALGGLVNGLNPDVIVVTGGIVKSLVPLQREILDCARQYALAPALAATSIHLIPGEKSQTVRGGAALVLYEQARRAPRP